MECCRLIMASNESTERTADMVRKEILARLRKGILSPGAQIIVPELARDLNVSRVPVREALHILAGEGIVDLSKNKSARIRPIREKDITDMLRLLACLGAFSLELAGESLHCPTARRSITAGIDQIIDALAHRDVQGFYQAAHAFHLDLIRITDNMFVIKAFENLHMDYFNRALSTRLPGNHWKTFERNYTSIRDALKAKNFPKASTIYTKHMQWAIGMILSESRPLKAVEG